MDAVNNSPNRRIKRRNDTSSSSNLDPNQAKRTTPEEASSELERPATKKQKTEEGSININTSEKQVTNEKKKKRDAEGRVIWDIQVGDQVITYEGDVGTVQCIYRLLSL
jgi:hypothetical protein